MSISLSEITSATFIQMLEALSGILEKAKSYVEARRVDEAVLLETRLIPDMFSFSRQVQLACDFARRPAALLAGVEFPDYPNDEKTLSDLQARIAKTVKFIRSLEAGMINQATGRRISFSARRIDRVMRGADYLMRSAIPNFYFHVVTAYDILRQCGVEIGKSDFVTMAIYEKFDLSEKTRAER